MRVSLIDGVIRGLLEEGLYVYNMHNIVEGHFSVSIALVRNQVLKSIKQSIPKEC
jgi:hypothetical protein